MRDSDDLGIRYGTFRPSVKAGLGWCCGVVLGALVVGLLVGALTDSIRASVIEIIAGGVAGVGFLYCTWLFGWWLLPIHVHERGIRGYGTRVRWSEPRTAEEGEDYFGVPAIRLILEDGSDAGIPIWIDVAIDPEFRRLVQELAGPDWPTRKRVSRGRRVARQSRPGAAPSSPRVLHPGRLSRR